MTKTRTDAAFGRAPQQNSRLSQAFPYLGEVKEVQVVTPYAMRVRRPMVWKVERIERSTSEKKVTLGQDNEPNVTFLKFAA